MAFHHFQFSKIPVIYISLFFISNAHKKLSYVYCGIENWWHFYPFQWNIDYRQRQGKRVTSLTTICRIVFLRSLSIKPWLRGCLCAQTFIYKKRLRRADRDFELVRRWKMSFLVDVSLFLPMCVCCWRHSWKQIHGSCRRAKKSLSRAMLRCRALFLATQRCAPEKIEWFTRIDSSSRAVNSGVKNQMNHQPSGAARTYTTLLPTNSIHCRLFICELLMRWSWKKMRAKKTTRMQVKLVYWWVHN